MATRRHSSPSTPPSHGGTSKYSAVASSALAWRGRAAWRQAVRLAKQAGSQLSERARHELYPRTQHSPAPSAHTHASGPPSPAGPHSKPCSTRHAASQPSELSTFPSSHSSPATRVPSPHTARHSCPSPSNPRRHWQEKEPGAGMQVARAAHVCCSDRQKSGPVHSASLSAPSLGVISPPGHSVHSVLPLPGAKVPGAHTSHAAAPPTRPAVPGGQGWQGARPS
mmetsp:Transcript_49972/g.118446  ORF Transcript_49972/g.118446 Transcript_49972/m.118446 type:complete len:224 (+) Transcript_49972:423-1094(+)